MPSKDVIKQFDEYDYERLVNISRSYDTDDVFHINEITDESLKRLAEILRLLIREKKIYLMDKESGVAFAASLVIGFKGDKLLIANER